jgi:KUP system potassium uptake protein
MPKNKAGKIGIVTILGILGAALLYSDGMLTPAVSVLSAVEGLSVLNEGFTQYVVPIALVVLVALFPFQKRGTEKIGRVYGPIMILWFAVIGLIGLISIVLTPRILLALNPYYAIRFLITHGGSSLSVMGSVFLAMTGAEVLYSDLGHFGATPIRKSWFYLVYPGLMLSYVGQGAHLLSHPDQVDNLFFRMAPQWALLPLVILATIATIIASQAVISGAFSIAHQSVQLGLWPRIQVCHTSDRKIGQVYVPLVNWLLLIGTVALVIGFRTSGHLSHAYGITVSATMLITTALMIFLMRRAKKMRLWLILPFAICFLLLDGTFFVANITKIVSGGWVVVVLAAAIFFVTKVWVDGRLVFSKKIQAFKLSPDEFVKMIGQSDPTRVKGTAIFLGADPSNVPKALLHNLKYNLVLHERTVVLSVQTLDEPYVERARRLTVRDCGLGIYHVVLHFGFSETPDVPWALEDLDIPGYDHNALKTTYFIGREAIVIKSGGNDISMWGKHIFRFLFNNAQSPTDFFRLPAERVVEIGAKTEL